MNRSRHRADNAPRGVAFSPDGKRLAIGYTDVAAVDVLDGTTLERVGGHRPGDATATHPGLRNVAWSRDGQTLFAAGGVHDAQKRVSFSRGIGEAWARNGA